MPFEPFIGEVMYIAGDFAPKGWALCNGQQMQIRQYTALYSLLGTTYGGDGVNTFNLPDLRGRALMGGGTSASGGGTSTPLGSVAGSEQVQLLPTQIPMHSHSVSASSTAASSPVPTAGTSSLGSTSGVGPDGAFAVSLYAAALTSPAPVASQMISANGGSTPHENRQPYNTLNACIALTGFFPSRS